MFEFHCGFRARLPFGTKFRVFSRGIARGVLVGSPEKAMALLPRPLKGVGPASARLRVVFTGRHRAPANLQTAGRRKINGPPPWERRGAM